MQEEPAANVFLLLAILVLLLHLLGISWLRQPPMASHASTPQPFKLEVTMLNEPSPKTSADSAASPQSKASPKKLPDTPEKTSKAAKSEQSQNKAPVTAQKAPAHKDQPVRKKPQDQEASDAPPTTGASWKRSSTR